MNIKMIVTDLDCTLLHGDKTISKYTSKILYACQKQGIRVVFATARSENSCKRFTEMIQPDAIISNGGALVRIGDKTIYRSAMSIETTNELLLFCLNKPSVGYITVDTDKGYFVNKPIDENDPGWIEYLPAYHVDFLRGIACDAYKITVEISDNTTAYEIASNFSTVDVLPFSGEGWYRFADKEADKWNGINALAADMEIALENIVTFGDDHNDVEMLRNCGIGIAVTNAIDEVKVVADYICDTNDNDGVAKWLEKNVLCN
jgi:Cof subfamily protein (haloacid dehalogenase superfamily)